MRYDVSMKRLSLVAFALLIPYAGLAQEHKIPVSVAHVGHDAVGALFASGFGRDLSRSTRYEPMPTKEAKDGLRFYVDLITVDVDDAGPTEGRKSAISVVIEEMGLPNSFPVPDKWYHKVIIVDRQTVDKVAEVLLEDLDARWCSQIKNSLGGCPEEKLEPKL